MVTTSNQIKKKSVVVCGVTEARNWDFVMRAHAAIQGTAHYYVVYDEIFLARKDETIISLE
jgi:hypothetical protein